MNGLMQIMPPTGKDIASRLGLSITEDDLLNPEIKYKIWLILRLFYA